MVNRWSFLVIFWVIVSGCTIHMKNGETITWPAPYDGHQVASTTYSTPSSGSIQSRYAYGLPPSSGYVPVANSTPSSGSIQSRYAYGLPPSSGYVPVANSTPGSSSTQPKYAYGLPPSSGYVPVANSTPSSGSIQSRYAYGLPPSSGYVPVASSTPGSSSTQPKYAYGLPQSSGYVPVAKNKASPEAYTYSQKVSANAPSSPAQLNPSSQSGSTFTATPVSPPNTLGNAKQLSAPSADALPSDLVKPTVSLAPPANNNVAGTTPMLNNSEIPWLKLSELPQALNGILTRVQ